MEYDIVLTDTIGWWPCDAATITRKLESAKGKPVNIYIESLGGDVCDALKMFHAIRHHGQCTAYIHGLTASAATIIAMGAQRIVASPYSLILIHRASQFVPIGWEGFNADEIEAAIEQMQSIKDDLQRVDELIASVYAGRSGKPATEMLDYMQKADWLYPADAKEIGIIDEVEDFDAPAENQRDIRVAAWGLPKLPTGYAAAADQKPGLFQRVKQYVDGLFHKEEEVATFGIGEDAEPQDIIDTNNTTTMNQDYQSINNALNIEGVEVNDAGEAVMSAENLSALNNALAQAAEREADLQQQLTTANETISGLQNEVQDLTAQVENLNNADGAETTEIEQNEGEPEEKENSAKMLNDAYNALKGLI